MSTQIDLHVWKREWKNIVTTKWTLSCVSSLIETKHKLYKSSSPFVFYSAKFVFFFSLINTALKEESKSVCCSSVPLFHFPYTLSISQLSWFTIFQLYWFSPVYECSTAGGKRKIAIQTVDSIFPPYTCIKVYIFSYIVMYTLSLMLFGSVTFFVESSFPLSFTSWRLEKVFVFVAAPLYHQPLSSSY